MDTLISFFGTASLAYLFGSIPFGFLLTRVAGVGDIRQFGSGNIGATNVMRTGHKGLGIATLLLDGLKGMAAVGAVTFIYPVELSLMAALFAVIGHVFPVWLRFRGGKGVATTIGAFFGLDWRLGLSVCCLWLMAFLVMRISSISSLLSISFSAIVAYIVADDITVMLCLILALLIVYTHRSNIHRLLEGTEKQLGKAL